MLEKLKSALARHPRLFDMALRVMPARSEAEHFFANLGKGIRFIQIGANDGLRWDPLRRSIVREQWSGLLVEPLPGVFPLLQRNYTHVPGVRCLQAAVGPRDDVLTFWTVSEKFLEGLSEDVRLYYCRKSSFRKDLVETALTNFGEDELQYLASRGHVPGSIDLHDTVVSVDVECLTINSLVAQHWQGRPPDLISIDAEGHEAQIIPAIDFTAVRPKVLFYEAFQLGAADSRVVEDHLRRGGYSVSRIGGDAVAVLQAADNDARERLQAKTDRAHC